MKTKRKNWTQKEINTMYDAYGHVPVKWICDELGRSYDSVRWQAKQLGLTKSIDTSYMENLWTEEEDDYLVNNYKKVPTDLISLRINRSQQSIRNRARMLGVASTRWTPDKVKEFQKNIGTKSVDKMCKFFEEN